MEKWEQERENYIAILKNANEAIETALSLDGSSAIIDIDTRLNITALLERNKIYLFKLEKKIFEVAVVGLEKAGKSTFANALISFVALPDHSERCTFTSTQLESGNNESIVVFYSRNEFNEQFRKMLKDLNFNNWENMTFDALPLATFREYFNSLEKTNLPLYNLHDGKTNKDIEDIIIGKDIVAQYLDHPPRVFADDKFGSPEQYSFITGLETLHSTSKDRTAKPRAVKKITVKSANLRDMPNIILYDVPGFDSPTMLHEEQTKEKLKSADAIILVSNVGVNPNLTGTQLNVLKNETDSDNIKLSEKIFVFGNQIDRSVDREVAHRNILALENDVLNNHKIAVNSRVFTGSAKAYLEKIELPTIDELGRGKKIPDKNCLTKLQQFVLDDGIEKIRAELQSYYEQDRFDILKRRINKNITDIKEVFNLIIGENTDLEALDNFRYQDVKMATESLVSFSNNMEVSLPKLANFFRSDILEKKYFTEKLKQDIEEKFEPVKEELLCDAELKNQVVPGENYPVISVNIKLRELLNKKFRDLFIDIAVSLANEKALEVKDNILENFANSIGLKEENPYYKEVKIAAEAFIERQIYDVSFDKRSFVHLLERFTMDLFEILILRPLGTVDRMNKFLYDKEDFYSLAMYHDKLEPAKPYYMQPLVGMILGHRFMKEYQVEETENRLREFLGQVDCLRNSLEEINIKDLAGRLVKNKVNLDTFLSFNVGKMTFIDRLRKLDRMSKENIVSNASAIINNFYEEFQYQAVIEEEIPYLMNLSQTAKAATTREDIIAEINCDIVILKNILKGPVLKAISLEKPFLSTVMKQINCLIDNKTSPAFSEFLSRHILKIKYLEFADVEARRALFENRRKIVEAMSETVSKIGG